MKIRGIQVGRSGQRIDSVTTCFGRGSDAEWTSRLMLRDLQAVHVNVTRFSPCCSERAMRQLGSDPKLIKETSDLISGCIKPPSNLMLSLKLNTFYSNASVREIYSFTLEIMFFDFFWCTLWHYIISQHSKCIRIKWKISLVASVGVLISYTYDLATLKILSCRTISFLSP